MNDLQLTLLHIWETKAKLYDLEKRSQDYDSESELAKVAQETKRVFLKTLTHYEGVMEAHEALIPDSGVCSDWPGCQMPNYVMERCPECPYKNPRVFYEIREELDGGEAFCSIDTVPDADIRPFHATFNGAMDTARRVTVEGDYSKVIVVKIEEIVVGEAKYRKD